MTGAIIDKSITIEVGGKAIGGTYSVKHRMITVCALNGSRTAQLGRSTAESLARLMLRELANEGKA